MTKHSEHPPTKGPIILGAITGAFIVAGVLLAWSIPALFIPALSFARFATSSEPYVIKAPPFDTHAYDLKMLKLAHVPTSSPVYHAFLQGSSTHALWPVRAAYPKTGALLPQNRIIAYYGNFYSKGMGVLGQYPTEEMLAKLQHEVAIWQAADPDTPVVPAIHYIVETAQEAAGKQGLYMARMPDSQIDHALELAARVHGIVFIDFQVGLSTLERELPMYEDYLKKPNVHLGIDPEFSMKTGAKPGTVIGTFDAVDVNFAAQYLAKLVRDNDLPPKVLIIHRFTQEMLTHAGRITPLPEVQVVIDMDGWGSPAKKIGTYTQIVAPEPVQFTGFKLFYKNDLLPPSTSMLTPEQLLRLTPAPVYIQYQ